MEFPSSIHSPRLVGSAGLIMRHEARTSTEQPAIVLVAPPDNHGAASLKAAHKALTTLRQDELPFPGCPSLIDYQESSDGGALLALGLRGAPLALAWPDEAVETDVLDLVIQHARLLAALHQAGFSGLQPGFEDLRWDSTHKSLLILGWEWVRENEESQHDDLQAAAALWVELLTGAAPPVSPPLTSETAWPAWQRVSLGTRALLSSILFDVQATATAKDVHEQLESMLKNWTQPVDELLSKGLDLFAREKLQGAQVLFDLAARRDPASIGAHRFQGVRETAATRFNRLINDVRIGSYHPTVVKFLQLAEGSGITAQERLRAWRWWTVTDTLWRLSPAQTPDTPDGQEKLAAALLETLDSIDRGRLKAALQQLQEALAEWREDQPPSCLQLLEVDLRVSLLIQNAVNSLLEDPALSVDLFEQAVSDIAGLPAGYQATLVSQIGDPSVGRWQARRKLERSDLLRRTVNEAKAALKADDLPLARQKWNDALRLTDRTDPERATIKQDLHRVHLRSQAVAAGVIGNPECMNAAEVSAALHALSALRRAFPRDTWGVEQAKYWQQITYTWLETDPTGPAGAWLIEYWPQTPEVKHSLEQAAPLALEIWNTRLAEITRDQELPKTPQRVGEWLRRLNTIIMELDRSGPWIKSTSHSQVFSILIESVLDSQMRMRAIAADQTRLLMQFKAAIDIGVLPVNVFTEAKQLEIELFDDLDRPVAHVLTQYYQPAMQSWARISLLLSSIDAAWQANDTDLALKCCNLVMETPELPDQVRVFVEAVSHSIRMGYKPSYIQTSDENSGREYHVDSSAHSSDSVASQEIKKMLASLSSKLEQLEKIVSTAPQNDEDDRLLRMKCLPLDRSHPVRVNIEKIQEFVSTDAFVEAEDLLKRIKKEAKPGPSKECAEQCERFLEHAKVKRIGVLLNRLADILETEETTIEADMVTETEYALSVLQPLMVDSSVYRSLKERCKKRMTNRNAR